MVFLLLLSLLLVACSNHNDNPNFPEELLSKEEGKYRLFVAHPNGDGWKSPEFFNKIDTLNEVLTGGTEMFLNQAQDKYPTLGIEKAPYFILFDTQKIVLTTDKENEIVLFLRDKLK